MGLYLFYFTVTFKELVDGCMVICVFTCIFNNTNKFLEPFPFEHGSFYLLPVGCTL